MKEQNISQWGDSNPYPNMGKLDAGEYELVISYEGYGIYGASQLTKTFKILENPNIVIGVSNITYGQTAQVNISINENITGDLEVEVDNVNKNIELFFQMKRSKSRDSIFIRIKRSWSLDIVGARRETYTLNTEEREGSSRVLTNTTQETSY